MAKTNPFGIFDPQTYKVKKTKINDSYYAFILLRSEFDDLSLLTKLFHKTQYLLKKSPLNLTVHYEYNNYSFAVYRENETLLDHYLLMFKNKASENADIQWIGFDKKALFKIKRKKNQRKMPQLTLLLDDDSDSQDQDNDCRLIQETEKWEENKQLLNRQTIAFEGRIDFVIPINIFTYEHFMPFFQHMKLFSEINYQLIDASEFENFEEVYYQLECYSDNMMAEENRLKNEKLDNLK